MENKGGNNLLKIDLNEFYDRSYERNKKVP